MKPEPVILLFILFLLPFMNKFLTNGNVALTYSLTKQYNFHRTAPLFSSWILAGFHNEPPLLKVIRVSFQVIVPL